MRENIFDISAPLAVFNSSICSQTLLNDSNNNNIVNIDEFSDEDILWVYKKNPKQDILTQTLDLEMRARFRWKKIIIILVFVKSLQLRVKTRIPVITITSTSTPSVAKMDQQISLWQTPVHKKPKRLSDALVPVNRSKESAVNYDGSFIIYQSIGSNASFIRTPNMRLFNIDLKTPSSVGKNQLSLVKNNFKFSSNLSTPAATDGSRSRNLLAIEPNGVRPSYSYSSIPYIDQEELDKIIKTEYNIHVINLCHIDDENDAVIKEKPCQNCLDNLFFIFKSITSSLREYLLPSANNKEKNI